MDIDTGPGQTWLANFEDRRGRPLRVLHIGNVANNAYNNAKIQRERGIDADVLSFDYYHIMATPEWEDADFAGDVGDPMFPDWWAVDLRGFQRPRWFVAGPLDACVRYLLAKNGGSRWTSMFWRTLELELWLLSRRGSRSRDRVASFIHKFTGSAITYPLVPANALILAAVGKRLEALGSKGLIASAPLGTWLRYQGRRLLRFGRTANFAEDGARHLRITRRYREITSRRCEQLLAEIGRGNTPPRLDDFYQAWWHPYMKLLFSQYDIIQCYSTYTAMPFVIQNNYVGYEHGTIRSIPFQETNEGRMCAASYRAANNVLVTNIDNIEAARRLEIASDRVTYLPHAFDDRKLALFAAGADRRDSGRNGVVTFLAPARQHWVDNDPGWAKGNDRVFAALRRVKDAGRHCVLRAVAWGNDLAASRARIQELGIEDMVEWLPEMKKRELWQEYLASNAAIDQFVVPAFGGVTFEALSLGIRVITHVDLKSAAEFFGEAPPVLSCFTADEIAEALLRIIDDPSDLAGIGRVSQSWVKRYHSADRIVAIQTEVYRKIINGPLDLAKDEICAWLAGDEPVEGAHQASLEETYHWERTTQGKQIVMLVVSALRIDPRVEREARALAARGWQVRIVAPDISEPPHSKQPLDWGPNIEFQLLPFSSAFYVMDPPWLIGDQMYQAAIATEPFAYHCHDLNTALVGLRAARRVGARWVCDFHEWSSENVTLDSERAMWAPHAPEHRLLLRWAETLAIRLADEVITVNESIAHELDGLGGGRIGRVKVVRNIPQLDMPPTRPYPPLKEQLGISPERFVVLYQGGTGPTRLLEPVIEALSLAPKATLVIRGPSLDLFGERYRLTARRFGVEERLVLLDPVPSRDVVAAGRGADVGLWTLPNLSKNFYYALPNKIFEYLASGLPLLVANFPEPKRIVESQEVGLAFDPYDPKSIAAQINLLIDNPALAERLRARVPGALLAMHADTELTRFADIYDGLRAKSSSLARGR